MPQSTATITGEQREAIYEFLVEQLSRLTDLPLAIKGEDFDTAKRLAREFSQYFRLLDDLGWGGDGQREVALTMSPEELVEALRRLYADADGALGGPPKNGRPAKPRKPTGGETSLSSTPPQTCWPSSWPVERSRHEGDSKAPPPRRAGQARSRLSQEAQRRGPADRQRDRQGHRTLLGRCRQLSRPFGEGEEGSSGKTQAA